MKRVTLTLACVLLAAGGAAVAAQPQQGQHKAHADVGAHQPWHDSLHSAVAASTRTPANVQRDRYRNPFDTLAFFGVQPNQTVVEIWPGGGWYTEILAPYVLQGGGTYYAASLGEPRALNRMMGENQALYGNIRLADFPAFAADDTRVPDSSADVVLTFRNVHNWRMGYQRDRQDYSVEAFRQMFAMLKPGGVLGIVDHRLPEGADAERERTSGYIKTSTVRRLAEEAGFEFVRSSEINANPRDTADYPNGVWTLPPSLRLGEQARDRYLAIGESDRMTLMFRRPR